MKIKPIIYPVLLILSLCVACEQEETPLMPGDVKDYILFSTPEVCIEGNVTSRGMHMGSTLPNGQTFGVWGYCQAYKTGAAEMDANSFTSEWTLKKGLCPPTLFSAGKINVTVGEHGCSYNDNNTDNGAKTWEADEDSRYTFAAVYPYNATGLTATFSQVNGKDVDAPKISYTMPYSGEVLANAYTTIPDVMIGWKQDHRKAAGHVGFTFYHIFSALSIQVNNFSEHYNEDNELTGKDLTIHSIKLKGSFHKTITVDLANGGEYTFNDSYNATYVIYDGGDTGMTIPYTDNVDTKEDETSTLLGNALMLLCGKPGEGQPFGPDPYNTGDVGIKLVLDYTFGTERKRDVEIGLLNPDLSFNPQVGVNYTFQLNWIGDGLVLLVMPASNSQWQDGEFDDGETDNDDVLFE